MHKKIYFYNNLIRHKDIFATILGQIQFHLKNKKCLPEKKHYFCILYKQDITVNLNSIHNK